MRAQHKHALATLHSQLQEVREDEEARIEESRRALLKTTSQKVGIHVLHHPISEMCYYVIFFLL